jgi:hypothetical protein
LAAVCIATSRTNTGVQDRALISLKQSATGTAEIQQDWLIVGITPRTRGALAIFFVGRISEFLALLDGFGTMLGCLSSGG